MRHQKSATLPMIASVIGLCCLFVAVIMLGTPVVSTRAQPFPTATIAFPALTPPPTPAAEGASISPTTLELLKQAQLAAEALQRQIDTVNAITNLVTILAAIFALVGILAAIFGLAMFFEQRATARRTRDLLDQVMDETKYMRVVQEAVQIRLGDMEKLRDELTKAITAIQNEMQSEMMRILNANAQHVTDLQTVVSGRIQEMDNARREVDGAVKTMRDELRDQLIKVVEQGDKQLAALLEVMNGRLRDLEGARRDVEGTSQEVRNHVRDGLLRVFERGDTHMKAATEAIAAQMRELESLREDIRLNSREFRDQIEGEIQAANATLSDLEFVRGQVDEDIKRAAAKAKEDRDQLFDRLDRLSQGIAMSQYQHQAESSQALALLQIGQQQAQQGNLGAAFDTLQNAAVLDPENRVIQTALADLYLQLGLIEDGLKQIEKARSGKTELPAADAAYAYALIRLGDRNPAQKDKYYTEATALLLVLADKHPNLLDITGESVYGALGGLYRRQGRVDQAIHYYERARKVTPMNTYPLNNLALLNTVQGNDSRAADYFRQSLDLARQRLAVRRADYWTWFDLLTAELALDSATEDTVKRLDQVVDLAPSVQTLEKFLEGLEILQRSQRPPALIDQVMARVHEEIAERRKA